MRHEKINFVTQQLTAPVDYFINDAKVITADVTASNGIIQIMDKVLYYPHEMKRFPDYLQNTAELRYVHCLKIPILHIGSQCFRKFRIGPLQFDYTICQSKAESANQNRMQLVT